MPFLISLARGMRSRHSRRAVHTVDVVTEDNKIVHMLTDTCGNTAFVQLKLWVDF